MLHVPARFPSIHIAFAPVFVQARTWQNARRITVAPGEERGGAMPHNFRLRQPLAGRVVRSAFGERATTWRRPVIGACETAFSWWLHGIIGGVRPD